ncbi:MAG: hypothetical protein FJ279_24970, partial [Planctomycetes bacterium]|nr:hypothetical protein [Planctomycetota bacterium]
MKPDCVLAIQLAALLVIHCVWAADAPVFEAKDGQEVSQWKPWGDPGDEFVTLTQSVSAPKDGRSCLRVEMRVVPGTSWWPAVGFDFPVETSWANVGAVELWVRPEGAMPDGLLNMSVHAGAGILASTTLTGLKAGQWNAVSLSGAFTGVRQTGAAWRLKLAAQPSVVAQPTPIALSVDGLRLTRAAERPTQIEKLKDLRLNTLLVERGQPRAAIVAPGDGRYADAVAAVQAAVRQCAGIELPVQHDQAKTKDVLAATNVIAFGNTATNRFVETLYCEWYTMTDLWYPGKGGYEVRSLHNPYGTGRNVIFFGGSDDAGVLAAAREFAALLKPGDPLQVGWLMKIKLGDALKPPKPGEKIFSWHDS